MQFVIVKCSIKIQSKFRDKVDGTIVAQLPLVSGDTACTYLLLKTLMQS